MSRSTPVLRNAAHYGSTYDKWIGTRFGRWVVVDLAGYKLFHLHVVARCGCGRESVVSVANLESGRSTQCDSCGMEAAHKTLRENSIGKAVGDGTVIARPNGLVAIRCPCGGVVKRSCLRVSGLCDDCLRERRTENDYLNGMSCTQIAALLGITKQAVSHYRIHNGDAALAARVRKAQRDGAR